MRKSVKFSPEVREPAVSLVSEQRGEHESQWAAVVSIAGKIGATPQVRLPLGVSGLRPPQVAAPPWQ